MSEQRREKFLIDSDCDPELVRLLQRVGFRARSVLALQIANDDTLNLIWAREHGYILVCHDKRRDHVTKYAFNSEMFYRGGQVIRISGQPGQDATLALGKILAQRPAWQEHFRKDSGQVVVHPRGCNFTTAAALFERTRYALKLPMEDPAVPLRERKRLPIRKRKPREPRASAGLM